MAQNQHNSKMNKQKKRSLVTAFATALFVILFNQFAQAQISTGDNYQVYMKEGNSTVARGATNVKFYDDHGPSYASDGNINYWDRWYATEKHYTYVFRPKSEGDKIKVTFKKFHAYEWSDTETNNCHDIGEFSLRINDDVLKVYNSDGAIAANLIAELTGTVEEEFTFMADGPMTFEFISNDQYREEGWGAEVTAVTSMTVQAPLIRRETCSDDILLVPTVPGATLYYTTNGTTPTTSSTQYTGPIEWPSGNITIKAIAVLNGTSSSVTTKVFQDKTGTAPNITWNDRMPTMEGKEPTLERVAGTNKVRITCPSVPSGLNETFYVSYTINNTLPTATNGNKIFFVPGSSYQYPASLGITVNYSNYYEIECTTPGTIIRARTFGYSCTNLESAEGTSVTINTVYVDAPTISYTTTNSPNQGDGQATIGNIMTGATVHYTTDGSEPNASSPTYSSSTPIPVTPGQTVKVIAMADTGYENSPVVSSTYIPAGGNGIYGGIVLLDDREDHSWSYYSDANSPIKSLNPADVKIIYKGFGENTMTTTNTNATGLVIGDFNANVSSDQVAVNHDATENQFIYLKTLEKDGESYPYTMIPNPFQVRPTYSSRGEGNGETRATNTLLTENFDAISSIATTYSSTGWYAYNGGTGNNWTLNTSSSYANSGSNSAQYAYNSSNAANCYLVSVPFAVNANMTDLTVSLYERVRTDYPETFEVFFVKASDVTTLAGVASATKYYAISSNSYSNTSFVQQSGSNTNSALAGQSVRLVVHCTSAADMHHLYIDDITVTETTSSGGGGGEDCVTENFSGVTATGYNSTGNLPDGWNSSASTGYAPHVSNNSYYTFITMDGNYLLMTLNNSNTQNLYAWAPQYTNITSVSFKYRYESTSVGTLSVGYVTGTTYHNLQTVSNNNSTAIQTFTLSSADITTINNNGGQLAFRFSGTTTSYYSVGIDDVEICVASGGGGSSDEYRGFYAWKVKRLGGGLSIKSKDGATTYGENTMIPAEEEVQFFTNNEDGNEVEFEALWAKAWVTTTSSTAGLNANASYERNFMVLGSNPGTSNTITEWPTSSSSTTTYGNYIPAGDYGAGTQYTNYYSITQEIYTSSQVGTKGLIKQIAFRVETSQNRNRSFVIYLSNTSRSAIPSSTSNGTTTYRTISVSSGDKVFDGTVNFSSTGWYTITLDTPWYYDGTSNVLLTVLDNTNSYHSLRFYTYENSSSQYRTINQLSTGAFNPVSYTYNTTSTNDISYYSNQIQFIKEYNALDFENLTVPLTLSSYYPNGTPYSSSVELSGVINAGADIKFENIKMNAIPILSAEGHNLVVGRGVEAASTGGITASYVRGLSSDAASPNYKIRLESGTYARVSMVDGYYQHESNITVSGTPKVWLTLGSDYDRASETYNGNIQISDKLNVTNAVAVGRGITIGSASMIGQETFKTWMKSGKVGSIHSMNNFYADFTQTLYMGSHGTPTYSGYRKLFIEGGEISGVAGGMDKCYTNTTTNSHTKTLTIRMTDGHIRSCIHGGAAQVPAGGDKEIIVTGGTVTGWIGAGCNGTSDNGGQTYGEGFVYFGGDAVLGGEGSSNLTNGLAGGNLFGAGNGRLTATTSGEMAFGTNVVVADQCDIEHDVYGGGNYGYAEVKANVYVLGGTVHGSVYGGANQKKGAVVNVTQQGGTIEGNIYGGSNIEGSVGGLSTINISGGTVNNVFGGGLGINTDMTAGTVINISGGTINNNVYGGGQLGKVSEGNTNVNISDGTMKEVYGAGMGESSNTADVNGQTYVNIMGGTMTNVYGGGQAGNVIAETPASAAQTLTYDFEDGSLPAGWTIRDADGDGDQWVVGSNEDFLYANGGSYYLASSYNPSQAVNNWVISQKIPLGGTISFYARRASTSYTDKFRVYVSTTGTNINDFTPVTAEITPTAAYAQYSYTIGTAGNKGYVAICHIADADQYALFLDNITITTPAVEAVLYDVASQVTIDGGTVNENVFGGGKMGTTDGKVVANLFSGLIKGHLFGGAYGDQGNVYVGGQKTVNITGGHVLGNVYGGSRNANDANALTGYNTAEQATTCEINMSAGKVDQNVYGAGYFGSTFGSVNLYLGAEAISSAPNHTTIDETINYSREGGLNIEGTIYAGGDWGTFTGSFGAPTVSGQSNVYIDGTGYNTTSNSTSAANYMKAGISVLGCGTSCDAGTTGRTLIVRNYGTAVSDAGNIANPFSNATRQLYSIQRFKNVIFDNAHLLFTGQGKVNSLSVTEKYGLYEDETVYLSNGSTMITNEPCSQIKSFQSVTCANTYANTPSFSAVAIDGLGSTGGSTDNKIRVNGGSYIEVKYEATGVTTPYGELKGWAHMMSSINDDEATCAYARPKQSREEGNIIPDTEDNSNDGGFVSYDGIYNQYTAAGALVDAGNSDQIRYENHTPNMRDDSQYFRIWRYGGNHTTMKAVFDAHATGEVGYKTVDVTFTLPPFRSGSHYYRFETVGDENPNTTIEYGSDVLTYNAACYNTSLGTDGIHGTPVSDGYMYYSNGQQYPKTINECPGKTDIDDNPDVNFGLVIMPNTTMVNGTNYIICDASDAYLAGLNKPFQCGDNTQAPEFTFRLTYSNLLSSNMSWDPMKIKLVQCDASGHITDYVTVELTVVTSTTITQNFTTKVYAIMDGHGALKDTYTAKMILPTYNVQTAGENSTFTITEVSFTPDEFITGGGGTAVTYIPISSDGANFHKNNFGLAIQAADTYDNTNVWFEEGDQIDVANSPVNKVIGKESGRNEVGIDITLFYSGLEEVDYESHMGTVTITVEFDNYAGTTDHTGTFNIIVEVYRIGQGENFYVDGVNGKDETGYGKNPDMAAKTVNYIFNRCNYRPGGNIFVVNTVTVSNSETWNGQRFNSVNMYRYPGKHKLSDGSYGEEGTNLEFTGKLVEVQKDLLMRNIVMDGMYAEATAASHITHIYPSDHGCNFDGESEAPLIHVADGGRLSLTEGTALKNNYNGSQAINGGGLCVEYGGIVKMDYDATITGNINASVGGVYVDGSLIVCDHVQITGNKKGTDASARQSNVWLAEATVEQAKANVHYKVIQIGTATSTDEFAELSNDARIGVDKEDWGHTIDGYMPVVYAEDGTEQQYLELPYESPQVVIFHDGNKYTLEKYTDEHYLYWISNWVNKQDHQPTAEEGGWDGIGNITTAEQFAWIISLVNGENECIADDFTNKTIVINNDIDMSASVWVPITNFKGTLEGNGHQIKGLNSSMVKDNMGMFGLTDGATIQNVVAIANFNADSENLGTIIGTMKNTTLSNVEAGGELEGKTHTKNMGGLVGKVESGTIHSAFAVNNMTAGVNTTVMGGLVGNNAGNLYNSYANTTMTGATKTGGLVGVNNGHVENCYAVVGTQTFPAFANTNNGVITICYADNANGYVTTTGEDSGVTLNGHGTYTDTYETHTYQYMYGDNTVSLETAESNSYVVTTLSYDNNQIDKWPGLLSSLNQWVNANSTSSLQYTKWLRPTTKNINDDLPVLCFPKDNCFATTDGKILDYSAFNSSNNGLDHLLLSYQDLSADIFLYGNTIEVANVPTANVNVYINEDVVLKQAASAGEFINAQVGVSFDNSCGTAQDFFGNTLAYDWHMLSTPLANAQLGISYSNDSINPWTMNNQAHQVTGVANSYMPDGTANIGNWDLYSFYEPEYHWINLKRNSASHHHYDEPYDHIVYKNEDFFTAGKGYMTAIDKDTYLCNKGTLNGPSNPVSVKLTKQSHEPGTEELGYNLLGNPYQAYLNMSAFLGANSLSSYWVYIAESNNYIAGNVRASDNPVLPSATLHPHQGFFVLASTDNQTVNFDYSTMASDNPAAESYFRSDKVNYPLVNLFVADGNGMKDLAVIEFNRPETDGSKKMRAVNNANFELAAFNDGERYSILFTEKGLERVPVTFVTHEDGEFTMTWSTLHGQFTQLLLIDNVTGVRTDMLSNDHYTFNGSADETAWRFYIEFNCIDNDDNTESDDFFAWFDGNDWIINGKGQLQLFDVLGHQLQSQTVSGETRLNLNNYAAGVYMLHLSNGQTSKSQKIVVR
jgi:hypothetical protein